MKEYRYAVKFAYDGTLFDAFPPMNDKHTVVGEILKFLTETGLIESIETSRFSTASRTDRNVSAYGNVFCFNSLLEFKNVKDILSHNKTEIFFRTIAKVDLDFNPRHAAYRRYEYYLPYFLIYDKNKDYKRNFNEDTLFKLREALLLFRGEHDFINFSRRRTATKRTITNVSLDYEESLPYVIVKIDGHSFIWNMVRRIISSAVKYASGEIELSKIKNLLDTEKIVSSDMGIAPAEFLVLKDIVYDNAIFEDINFNNNSYQKKNAFRYTVVGDIFKNLY